MKRFSVLSLVALAVLACEGPTQPEYRFAPSLATIPAPETTSTIVYVANRSGKTLSVIAAETNTVVETIAWANFAGKMAITPDGSSAYVVSYGTGLVSVLDTESHIVSEVVDVGFKTVGGPAVTPDGGHVYVPKLSSVAVIETASNTVVATVPNVSWLNGVTASPDGAFVYTANGYTRKSVGVIDTATNQMVDEISLAYPGVISIAIMPDGSTAYVAHTWGTSNISVIDLATRTAVTPILSAGSTQRTIGVSPDGTAVYVTHGWKAFNIPGRVSVISTASKALVATIPVGDDPVDIAFTPDGAFAYVTNSGSNTVSVIDTGTLTVTATIAAGIDPWGVAVIQRELTPEQQLQAILDAVLAAADLNGNVADALASKLENVLAKLDKGNPGAAINQLGAFINQIEALVQSGDLDQASADALIAAAQAVIDELSG